MDSQITYNIEVDLTAPPGGVIEAIFVTVEIEPADAGVLIYGKNADGSIGYVEVRGSKTDLDLPFAHPKVYVRYLAGLQTFRISTRGFRDAL